MANIFVLSGPGGAGKTTVVNQLFHKEHIKNIFIRGVTVTTRPKRPKEEEGKDYFFVSKEEFLRLEKKKFFLESQTILDNYYGTPKLFYTLAKKKNKILFLCIDVRGGIYLKRKFGADKMVTIFLTAPTGKLLRQRMKKREEAKALMQKKADLAEEEIRLSKRYDYLIVNRNLKSTLEKIEEILAA